MREESEWRKEDKRRLGKEKKWKGDRESEKERRRKSKKIDRGEGGENLGGRDREGGKGRETKEKGRKNDDEISSRGQGGLKRDKEI